MKKATKTFFSEYFGENIDLNIQSFNLLGFAGMAASLIVAVISIAQKITAIALICIGAFLVAFVLIHFTGRKISYRTGCWIVVISVFIIAFPVIFFFSSGYNSGMPCFFIFAIIFTTIILERRDRIAALIAEYILYIGCCLIAYFSPDLVSDFPTEAARLFDVTVGIVVCGILLMSVILLHIRMYNVRHKELEKANDALHGLNRMKTEFLQDMSHEMQNPLTTIIRGIGFADGCIDKPDGAAVAHDTLKLAENEAMRLGRMVSSMVNLAAMSGSTESREKINFAEVLKNCAEMFRLQLDNRDNTLNVDISPELPYVYGVADRLKQVPINLLTNVAKHTRNGEVTLEASLENDFITVRISDTGEGIPRELLPHVFERGVSSNEGFGYGLSICRTIVEAHGGEIHIESELGKGTTATFTIPVYGGQSEARRYE